MWGWGVGREHIIATVSLGRWAGCVPDFEVVVLLVVRHAEDSKPGLQGFVAFSEYHESKFRQRQLLGVSEETC